MSDIDKEIMEHELKFSQIKQYVEFQNQDLAKEDSLAGRYGTLLELAARNMSVDQTCALVERMVLAEIQEGR